MAKRGKLWHGKNVFKAGNYVKEDKSILDTILSIYLIFFIITFFYIGITFNNYALSLLVAFMFIIPLIYMAKFYRSCIGISGENCAMIFKGRVKGFKKKILTDGDIAMALQKMWLKSLGHRNNILNSDFQKIGVSIYRRGNQFFATTLFYG
jgi:accessory gene regulator protein AgrB